MSAKEMFEELGYELKKDTFYDNIEYFKYKNNRNFDMEIIRFVPRYKEIMIMELETTFYTKNQKAITLEELQAINKQVEELGWLCYETKK